MRVYRALRPHWAAMLAPLAAGVLALLVMEIWRARRGVPFTGYGSDGMLNLALVKGVLQHGWFQENPSVAAPYGQELYDFTVFSGDNLHFALIKVLGIFSDDPSFVLNIYLLASFPLVALSALLVLRALGASAGASVVCSVLFSLLPYHFVRGLSGHVFLAAYYSVPLGFYLVVCVLAGRPLLERVPGKTGPRAYFTRRSLATLAMCVVIAATGIYYALFTLILLVVTGVLAAFSAWHLRPALRAAGLVGLLGALLAVNFSPNLVYRAVNGANEAVGQRSPAESETFAAKLTHLLLPVSDHRIDALARVTRDYLAAPVPPPEQHGVSLGTAGVVGFVVLLGVLLASGLRVASPSWRWRRLHEAAVVAFVTFLFVTAGGLSSVVAFELSPQVRGWYRLSIFIAFAALLAVAFLLDAIRESPRIPRAVRSGFPVVLAAVLALGVLDQTTRNDVPRYAEVETQFRNDRDFVNAIEARLPDGAEVFQLPFVAFPESVVNRIDASEPARGYVHSHDLEWSWGAMRGREEDWQAALADDEPRQIARAVAAAGFEGLWLDRFGYADNGAAVEAALRSIVGAPSLTSAEGRFVFYDLRPLRRRMERVSPAAVERLGRETLAAG